MFKAFNFFSDRWYGNFLLMGLAAVAFPPLFMYMLYKCFWSIDD